MKIELDLTPEPEPKVQVAVPTPNPYQAPSARLVPMAEPTSAALWNPNAAANWSLPLTPAFGSYLHYLNWKALGQEEKARTSWIWFVVSMVILGLLPIFQLNISDPNVKEFAPRGICFWFLIIWYFAAARSQARFVKERFDTDYERRSWGMPLLIALGSILAYFLYCFAIAAIFMAPRH